MTPEELEGEGGRDGRAQPRYSTRREAAGLFALSGAGALAFVAGVLRSSHVGVGLGLSVALGPLLFLVLRNLGAALAARCSGLVELLREARELWRRGDTAVPGSGEAVLGCARPGCGAVYHAECWEECKASYGACAVFACGSHEATGLSDTQLRLRGLRLLLAAFLFPQRLVDAVRKGDDEGDDDGELSRLRAAIRARAAATHENLWAANTVRRSSGWMALFSLLQLGVVLGGALVGYAAAFVLFTHHSMDTRIKLSLVGGIGLPVLLALGLYGTSWFAALALYAAKSLLSAEFSALARLGQRGAFLSRSSSKKG